MRPDVSDLGGTINNGNFHNPWLELCQQLFSKNRKKNHIEK